MNRGKGASWYVDEIENDEVFAHVEFRRAHDRGLVDEDISHLWRVVGIDTLGPIAEQIQQCRGKLRQVYEQHLDAMLVKTWFKKFPRAMPMEMGNSEPTPGSNCYLRALLTIAKLIPEHAHDKSTMQNNIAKELQVHDARHGWRKSFQAQLDEHITLAEMHRWLVHDQISFESFAEPEKRNRITT